jgi:hypothetical protein
MTHLFEIMHQIACITHLLSCNAPSANRASRRSSQFAGRLALVGVPRPSVPLISHACKLMLEARFHTL